MTTSTTLEPTTTNEGFPERFIQVCPSDNFTLFLQASGDAWSCGENSRGQLGNQSNESSSTPLIFARGFIKLDVGQFHSGGLDVNKRLFLWGDGWHGEQAIDPNLISENVDERFISLPTQRASAVHDFALGNARTFLINSGGLILACGENTNGVLGTASTENHVRDFELVVTPEGLKFEKIDAGMNHFGAIDENGALWMWGSNEFNKLSLPGETLKVATKVIDANVRSVSCGEDFTLVTLTNGRVLAVGKGGWGQTSSWFDVVGQPSRDYALIEVWGSSDPDFIRGMKIIYADFSQIMLFLDDFYAFKFVPDITSGFKTTKLGTIYSRYTAPFIENADGSKTYDRSNYLFIDVTFQETGFELFEPKDLSLDGWGSSNGDSIVLSYTIDQLTTSTSTSSTTEEPTTSTSSTTEEPTTSTSSTTEEPTTSTSSTTEEPTTSTSSTTEEPTTSTSSTTEEPTTSTSTSTTSTSTTEEPTTSSTTEEPGDPIISSPSEVELYVGAKFLDDGNVPWIVTSKTDADNYEMKSQGREWAITDQLNDTYEFKLVFSGVNWTMVDYPHSQYTFKTTTTGHWWVHDGETDNHPNRTSNHDGLPDLRLQLSNRSDGRRGSYFEYVSPNDENLNNLYDANIINPVNPTTSTSSTTEEPTTSTSTTIDPASLDSDGDGINDAEDYFFNDNAEVLTKTELESFGFDSSSQIADWDRIKFITNNGNPDSHPGMIPGEFYLIGDTEFDGWRVMGRAGSQVDTDGNILKIYSPDRGILWEKLSDSPTTTTSTTTTSTTTTSTTSTSTTSTSTTEEPTTSSTTSTTQEPTPTEFDTLDEFMSFWCENNAGHNKIAMFPTTLNSIENRNGSYTNFQNFSPQGLGAGDYEINSSGDTIKFTNPAPGYSHYSSASPVSGGTYNHDLGNVSTGGSSGVQIEGSIAYANYTRWNFGTIEGDEIQVINGSDQEVNASNRQINQSSVFIGDAFQGEGQYCFHTLLANYSFEIGSSLGYFEAKFLLTDGSGKWQYVKFFGQAVS